MKRFSQILLYFTVFCLLLWQLPWCYNFFAVKAEKSPFTLYSIVIHDFVQMIPKEEKGLTRCDINGKTFTEAEFDSILPTFYARQLIADERFPDSINGISVTPRAIQISNFTFRCSPSDINAPKIGLYPLLESISGRVDLEMPDDVFRITSSGIDFIDIASNQVKKDKSILFTKAMLNKGFCFPALRVAGNPTTRKEYDEGYILLDANHQLFHLKQMRGRPFVRVIKNKFSTQFEHVFITEFKDKKTLAFITDSKNELYVLNNKTYEIIKTGVKRYNPTTDGLVILGDMFSWTVKILTPTHTQYYALDANDYSLVKYHEEVQKSKTLLGLNFTSSLDKYVLPRFD